MDRVVIGEKLCPFAPPLLADNKLRIVASSAANEQDAVAHIRLEAAELVGHSKEHARAETNGSAATLQRHETTLVVFDAPFVQEFRDFVRLSWILQDEAIVDGGYQKDLQLVLFHPKATHQTYSDACESGDGNDHRDENFAAGDYTIRSPYPTVHLLREVDVMRAVTGNYPNLPELPTRNKLKLMEQGYAHCKARLEECYIQGIGNEAETSTR